MYIERYDLKKKDNIYELYESPCTIVEAVV